jgi:hypothetical protein
LCDVRRGDALVALGLREGATLGELEGALEPVLPSTGDVIAELRARGRAASNAAVTRAFALNTLATALTQCAQRETALDRVAATAKLHEAVEVMREALALPGLPEPSAYPLGIATLERSSGIALVRLGEALRDATIVREAVAAHRRAAAILDASLATAPPAAYAELRATRTAEATALMSLSQLGGDAESLNEAIALLDRVRMSLAGEASAAPADQGRAINLAVIELRLAVARLLAAEHRRDRAGAQAAFDELERVDAALSTNPAVPFKDRIAALAQTGRDAFARIGPK